MKCYTEYSKIAMQYNESIKFSTIGIGFADIQFETIKKDLSKELGFETLNKYIKNCKTIDGIYTDARTQVVLGNREQFLPKKPNLSYVMKLKQ